MPRKGGGKMPAVVKVTQKQLARKASQPYAIRKGATVDPPRRVGEYRHQGFKGKMYAAPTKNMMKAEDKLLKNPGIHNKQTLSNAQAKPGFTYSLQGKLTSKKPKVQRKKQKK